MFESIKREWRSMSKDAPGLRFQAAYERGRKQPASAMARVIRFIFALVAIVVGVIFAFIPGPAVVFFALAGVLLAAESKRLAIAMDWGDRLLHALVHWALRHWRKLGLAGRIVVVAIGASGSMAMAGFTAWMFFFR